MKNSLRLILLAACASAIPAFADPPATPPVAPPSVLALAGYQPLIGEGVVVTLSDQPQPASKNGVALIPGLVHDYDVLFLVNELRSAGAQGITVGGVRLTNQSSIRCTGPRIFVGKTAVSIPLRIEAVGNAALLKARLQAPGSFIRTSNPAGPKIQLRVVSKLRLSAAPLPAPSSTPRP